MQVIIWGADQQVAAVNVPLINLPIPSLSEMVQIQQQVADDAQAAADSAAAVAGMQGDIDQAVEDSSSAIATATAADAKATEANARLDAQDTVYAVAYGGFWDGVGDDTAAINAAIADLRGGSGVVYLPHGIVRCNIQIIKSGVILEGRQTVGNQTAGAYPTTNMMIAHDPTQPVVTLGSDTLADGATLGSGIRNISLRGAWDYGGGRLHADYGLKFAGGSHRCFYEGGFVRDFGETNISWNSASGFFSAENRLTDITSAVISATNKGAIALLGEDMVAGGTYFSNDHFLTNVYLVASEDHVALKMDGTMFWASTVKIDCPPGGIILQNTIANNFPRIYGNVEVDGPTEGINVLDFRRNLTSEARAVSDFIWGRGSVDGYSLHSALVETVSVTQGSLTFTAPVTNIGEYYEGRAVLIYSTSGISSGRILSVAGQVVTLDTAIRFTDAAASVYVGDVGAKRGNVRGIGSIYNLYEPTLKGPAKRAELPYLAGRNELGNHWPYNTKNLIWDFDSTQSLILSQAYQDFLVPVNVSRTAGVAEIKMGAFQAPNGDASGWFVTIRGVKEPGFNGSWPLTTVINNYRSQFANPGADVAAATGAIRVAFWRAVEVKQGEIILPAKTGIKHRRTEGGEATLLTEDTGNAILAASDITGDGRVVLRAGAAVNGTTDYVTVFQSQDYTGGLAGITGYGALVLGSAKPVFLDRPAVILPDIGSNPTTPLGTDAGLMNWGGSAAWRYASTTYRLARRLANVPATATSPGMPGDYAVGANYVYHYTGDGVTHSWVRGAVATW